MKKYLIPAGWLLLWLTGPLAFLLLERGSGLSGFPLDDAWIHQTYARSLADGQGWTYAGGPQSAGSTSPLWTVMQIPSFWFHISPVAWSKALGILLLLANAVLIMLWIRKIARKASRFALFFCLGEWHLVWAAVSGMETILYCAWTALVFFLIFPMDSNCAEKKTTPPRILGLGIIAGLGIWIRPEAVLLSGLAFLAVLLQWRPVSAGKAGVFILGLLTPILIYFMFMFRLNGHLLPNTFFVKTTEYAVLTSTGLLIRLLQPWHFLKKFFVSLVLFVLSLKFKILLLAAGYLILAAGIRPFSFFHSCIPVFTHSRISSLFRVLCKLLRNPRFGMVS